MKTDPTNPIEIEAAIRALPVEEIPQYLDRELPFNEFLIQQERASGAHSIYKNPNLELELDTRRPTLIYLLSVTGAGKTVLANEILKSNNLERIRTATSRARRESESEDAYVFMRPPSPMEKQDPKFPENYFKNLIEEYELVEHDVHHNNLYGVPAISFGIAHGESPTNTTSKRASQQTGIEPEQHNLLLVTEPSAIPKIHELVQGKFNEIVLFIIPDSWQQIYERIVEDGQSRDNLRQRFIDSAKWFLHAQSLAHFFIHNTADPELLGIYDASESGLSIVKRDLSQWLKRMLMPSQQSTHP